VKQNKGFAVFPMALICIALGLGTYTAHKNPVKVNTVKEALKMGKPEHFKGLNP
jgi:hypothetical protein